MSNPMFLPPQLLSFKKKDKKWRKLICDWADSKTYFNYNLVRKSVTHKKINYDLMNGILHMSDVLLILNPDNINAGYVAESIQHYPIINSKLNVLKGEESKRLFDYRVIITNPDAISEIENNKKSELLQSLQLLVSDNSKSDDEFNQELERLNEYFTYEWLDLRELRGNELLNHYVKELSIPLIFNNGFMDAMTVGEEIYQCDIIGGEPTIERLNPLKVRIFRSGISNKIEDADIIIIEDYWSPGKIIDAYYDVLTKQDMEYIEKAPLSMGLTAPDSMNNIDDRAGFVNNTMIGDEITSQQGFFWDPMGISGNMQSLLPYDLAGNLRVLRVYWKSRRRIKKVKSYDPLTGEELFNFYPEDYIINKEAGEEELIFWVNEAWEGTKIGQYIYVNMRPRVVQYNRLSNPSRCHFGIIGSIYNFNDSKPFSLVDMMKPYNYLYDVMHDRLNKLIARNWGNLLKFDLAKKPNGWDVEKWIYYAKTMGLVVEDSFKEGSKGAATGKLAGAMNNASNGVVPASDGNMIQQYINLLEFIKMEMSEVVGISKQREGLISNRETVGGVERSTLLSSYITEWVFNQHENVKKRVLECFLETAKIAMRGRSKKFSYITSDTSQRIMEIDGDEFAECDYGLVIDTSNSAQELNLKLDMLALAALLNSTISFSTVMKLYNSCSLAQKQRMIEKDERAIQERNAQALKEQIQSQQLIALMLQQQKLAELELKEQANIRDNETKVLIASMSANMQPLEFEESEFSEEAKSNLEEKIREFDAKLKLDRDKLNLDKLKATTDAQIKREQLKKKTVTNNK